ncbi:hypothetical protein [uncultured Flavonifractor sp.]|uniref:hypothetical protein n=1 Tax=uncultured Flavonifractor sp. TaxID=1193534 RepID=UPI00174B4FA5|nr:hypothetical protein [uncultured Flavonifractor sp.]
MDGKVKANLLKEDSVMAKKALRRLLALTFALAMMCSVTAGAVSGSVTPVSTERRIINREIAPGVVLLDEGYDMDFGVYTFTRTYKVNLSGTRSVFVMEDINNRHHDGLRVLLVDDSSSGTAPVETTVQEYPRHGLGIPADEHFAELEEGEKADFQLTDPVGCTYSIYAAFKYSGDSGRVTLKISCDDYDMIE